MPVQRETTRRERGAALDAPQAAGVPARMTRLNAARTSITSCRARASRARAPGARPIRAPQAGAQAASHHACAPPASICACWVQLHLRTRVPSASNWTMKRLPTAVRVPPLGPWCFTEASGGCPTRLKRCTAAFLPILAREAVSVLPDAVDPRAARARRVDSTAMTPPESAESVPHLANCSALAPSLFSLQRLCFCL